MAKKTAKQDTLGMERLVEIQAQQAANPIKEGAVISDVKDLFTAIAVAQMKADEFVEVTEDVFKYLVTTKVQGAIRDTNYINWGNPTIRIYREGTREKIEKWEAMDIDQKAGMKWEDVEVGS